MNDLNVPTRGVGDNSGDVPELFTLDPELIREQLGQDYGSMVRKRDDLLEGVARLCLKYSDRHRFAGGDPLEGLLRSDQLRVGSVYIMLPDGGRPAHAVTVKPGREPNDHSVEVLNTPDTIRHLLNTIAIPDEEVAARVVSFVRQIKDHLKPVEAARVKEKGPYDGAASAVQSFFKATIADPLGAAASGIETGPLKVYAAEKAAAERRRREAEAEEARQKAEQAKQEAEAARKAAEAAMTERALDHAIDTTDRAIVVTEAAERLERQAAAPVRDMARTRGSAGGVLSARSVWRHRVVDPDKVPDEYWVIDHDKLAALARQDKAGASVPGVEFFDDVSVRV
jgi:hypothetical protein